MDTQANPTALANSAQEKFIFLGCLHEVANRIHATETIDEIIIHLSREICELFGADRLSIYTVNEDGKTLCTKVKNMMGAYLDVHVPISDQSVAGYVAGHGNVLNIRDAYDEAELRQHGAALGFDAELDRKTGYRTKQILAAPVIDVLSHELLGVVELINTRSGQPFPPVTETQVLELTKTLFIAFKQRQKVRTQFDALLSKGTISAAEMDLARLSAQRKHRELEDVLIDEFQVLVKDMGQSLADFYNIPYEPYQSDRLKPDALLANMKRDYLLENGWVPIAENGDTLVVLTIDPDRVMGSGIVHGVFPKYKLDFRVSTRREFARTVELFYGKANEQGSLGNLLSNMEDEAAQEDKTALGAAVQERSAAEDNELVKLVNKVIVNAYNQGASDIHIEPSPGKDKTLIRLRKDGTLYDYVEIPASYRAPLVTRLKIMCDLDISEKRKPQDGKIEFKKYGPLNIELRVATIPTQGGVEDVVMRILAAGEPIHIDDLGLSTHNLATLKNVVSKPYGMFLVCGPTGSGKTTTLHSVLNHLNTRDTKIWTAEDPVEITQKGLRQVQVNPKSGYDFATAMRAFLRADPDIVMVGEMRDKETVSIGIEASLTGHLVFSTLHTNSALESVVRLLDMGMDPFNFADALLGILAQRLAKSLCSSCKEAYAADEAEIGMMLAEYCSDLDNLPEWKQDRVGAETRQLDEWKKAYADSKGVFTLYRAKGCEECNNTGYRGRVGLHELLVGTDAIKKSIQDHVHVADMTLTALSEGMRTLRQDGIEKVLQGRTDMKKVRAVCIK